MPRSTFSGGVASLFALVLLSLIGLAYSVTVDEIQPARVEMAILLLSAVAALLALGQLRLFRQSGESRLNAFDRNYREQARINAARSSVLDGLLQRSSLSSLLDDMAREWEALQPGQRVSVLLCSPETGRLFSASSPTLPAEYVKALDGLVPGENIGSCGSAVFHGEPVYVSDVTTDPRWADYAALIALGSFRACWSMPFKDENGIVLGTFAIYNDKVAMPTERDISLLKEFTRLAALVVHKSRLATERETSEKRFSAIFEHAAVCILLMSPDGKLLSVNPRFEMRSGYSSHAVKDLPASELLHPDEMPGLIKGLRALRIGEAASFNMEARFLNREKALAWVNLTVTLVRDADGKALYYVMFAEEIDERKKQEQALREAAAVFEGSREGMVVLGLDFRILNVNPAYTEITGRTREQVVSQRPFVRGHTHDPQEFMRAARTALTTYGYWQGEAVVENSKQQEVTVQVTASAVRDVEGNLSRYVVMFSDITRLRHSQEQLQLATHYDSLTGLANRTLAMQHLEQNLGRAAILNSAVAVLFVDLDRFKAVNDSLGHASGDAVLREIANRLAGCCLPGNVLARLGGDEFLLIIQEQPRTEIDRIASAICNELRQPLLLADAREIYLGASVGYACYPGDGLCAADLVRNADAAMATAKDLGRDRACGYSREMTEAANERFELDRSLRKALENHELELFYQPLVQVRSRRATGVEALLRWRHPERGMIGPDIFIPLAEQNGLIVQIGRWALNEACRQAREWQQQGLGLEFMAVNLSPKQFVDQNVVELVRTALEDSGLPATMLELEITEGALMTSAGQGEQTLHELKSLGVGIAIDDFGTGYSSLAYLRRFPLDRLKIDKSFLAGVPEQAEDNQLVTTILDMAANMHLEVVAEGVETEAQWRFLQSRGCGMCQGYLFARPMPASELVAWLTRQ